MIVCTLRNALMEARTDLRLMQGTKVSLAKPLSLISETLTCLTIGRGRVILLAVNVCTAIIGCAFDAECANDAKLAERLRYAARTLSAVVGQLPR